ncbi:MAG: Asp-tRNA(Asn)/Glu-tRNA(Gln) amidotransferase A subunit family amidase [Myxococcota bacterium]|jgi:Asp-tRNA(Asn)/Glu-tRNA(Gln) amidotransferase A subunit family amidase
MSYDLVPVKAPRAAGNLLKMLAPVLENPITGAALAGKILADAGIQYLRDIPCDAAHTTAPPLPMLPAPNALTPTDTAPPSLDLPRQAIPGFSFETAADFTDAYAAGRVSPIEVAERVLAWTGATESQEPKMRIFISQRRDDVMRQAEASARRWRNGESLGPLDGVPVAVKDELDQTPYPTTVGTAFLGRSPASSDATPVARMRAAGALLIGKTNMHEMGLGVTGVNPHHGACRNPYDPARAPGGSSSGVAAAVAAGLCPIAIGADGGGSIRIPASLCGVVGLKATWGRVSEHGAAPLCWSVAHVGPIAATVRDTALAYAMMAGPDPLDPNSLRQPPLTLDDFDRTDLTGIKIGVFRPWFEDAEAEVVARCREALGHLEAAGATIVDVIIPELRAMQSAHLVTIASEMAAAHARYFAEHRKSYGLDTRMNLALARRLTAADYVHAQRHRTRLCQHFTDVLRHVDVIATPSTGCTAPLIPADSLVTGESNLPLTATIMRFAQPGNLTGLPGISVPAGYDDAGMPVGLQLMGRPWAEHTLLNLGRVVEAAVSRQSPVVYRGLLSET